MQYLALSILFTSVLFIIFKTYKKYEIDTFQAIVVNYFVAFSLGYFISDKELNVLQIPNQSWFIGALILGFLFIAIFNVLALTAQKSGVGVAAVASKMSVVIPILFAVLVYQEELGVLKLIGIILALAAVVLVSIKRKIEFEKISYILPLLLFLGSGMIDTTLKYIERTFVTHSDTKLFTASIFLIAGIMGIITLLIKSKGSIHRLKFKNFVAGIVLGIPNYFSIYFLIKALQTPTLESSTIFTLNNVSVVMLTTLLGLLIFKEKLIKRNWLGIFLALLSIILVTY